MKRPESRAVFATNGEGETVVVGYEYVTTNKKEQAATEAGIKLAREIGRERAARRAPIKERIRPYLVETDDDDR